MSRMSKHLPPSTLEALAEGDLPPQLAAAAEEHLSVCAPCAAEREASRAIIASLGNLQRFAPSASFSAAVMARVRIAAAPHPFMIWVQRWLPRARQSWSLVLSMLLAPVIALGMAAGWMLSTGEISVGEVWQWSAGRARDLAWSVTGGALNSVTNSGAAPSVGQLANWALDISPAQGLLAAVLAMVAVTLSAWALLRLMKTPAGELTHA